MNSSIVISPKLMVGETGYGISKKKIAVMDKCPYCDGVGSVTVDDHVFSCVRCSGTGSQVVTYIQRWVVDDQQYTVKSINVKVDIEGPHAIYKVKTHSTGRDYNRSESTIFASEEEALIVCKERNKTYSYVQMSDVRIPEYFTKSIPRPEKIAARVNEIRNTGKFNTSVVVNKDNVLKDGYSAYLVAKMLDFAVLRAEVI